MQTCVVNTKTGQPLIETDEKSRHTHLFQFFNVLRAYVGQGVHVRTLAAHYSAKRPWRIVAEGSRECRNAKKTRVENAHPPLGHRIRTRRHRGGEFEDTDPRSRQHYRTVPGILRPSSAAKVLRTRISLRHNTQVICGSSEWCPRARPRRRRRRRRNATRNEQRMRMNETKTKNATLPSSYPCVSLKFCRFAAGGAIKRRSRQGRLCKKLAKNFSLFHQIIFSRIKFII